jgi:secreted PhoX family phosphatase
MTRIRPISALLMAVFSLTAACTVVPPTATAAISTRSTRDLMTGSIAGSLAGSGSRPFSDFSPLIASATCGAQPTPATVADLDTYQPFLLPEGFTQTIITTERDPGLLGLGMGVDNFDMLTLNETGPEAGRFLYRTHEVGSNGSLSVTDLRTGETRIVANASHYEALDGLTWTPWGTVLFAEERIVASLKDPMVPAAVGGLVYEYDPATGVTVPRPAIGSRSHEGLRFDPQGNLYGISESTPGNAGQSGAIFKFVADRRGDLTSGQLYALKVVDGVSRTGPATWIALDRGAVQVNSDAEAIRVGATGWARPEDIEIATSTGNARGGAQVMYVATTTDDLVLRIRLEGDQAFVSDFVREGVNVSGLQNPDNVALDSRGDLFIAEDNGPGDIWVARANGGPEDAATEVVRFASLTDCAAEPTGIYFDRSGKVLYVNVQHAGGIVKADLTVVIKREE